MKLTEFIILPAVRQVLIEIHQIILQFPLANCD
jgi:hypothetical protein